MKGIKFIMTVRQEKWLARHFKHTKNEECAARLGISLRTLIRLARQRGLAKSRQFMAKSQAEAAEAAKVSHIMHGTYPPKGFRIPNSEASQFKKGVTSRERLGSKREAQRIAKAAETRRKTIRRERARIAFGCDQRTLLRLVANRPKAELRHAMRKKGYIIDRGGNEVHITAYTCRSSKYESMAVSMGMDIAAEQ